VVQGEVDAPGEQQVIEGAHQPQAVGMVQAWRHQGEVDVGAEASGGRPGIVVATAGCSTIPLLAGGGPHLLAHQLGGAAVVGMAGEVAVLNHGQPTLAIADQTHPEGQP